MKKKILKRRKGQGIIEFAIVMPLLILLLLGVVEFGWLLNGKITLNSAAREGARVGAVALTNREQKVLDAVTETSSLSGLNIVSVDLTEENMFTEGKYNVLVTVNGKMTPIIGLYVSGDVEMSSSARMRRE